MRKLRVQNADHRSTDERDLHRLPGLARFHRDTGGLARDHVVHVQSAIEKRDPVDATKRREVFQEQVSGGSDLARGSNMRFPVKVAGSHDTAQPKVSRSLFPDGTFVQSTLFRRSDGGAHGATLFRSRLPVCPDARADTEDSAPRGRHLDELLREAHLIIVWSYCFFCIIPRHFGAPHLHTS
jgi:hypothetical protein